MSFGQLELLSAISKPSILAVFKTILKSRVLSRYQLDKNEMNDGELEEALDTLQGLGLIEKKSANFPELDKYFPTKEGLAVEKIVK